MNVIRTLNQFEGKVSNCHFTKRGARRVGRYMQSELTKYIGESLEVVQKMLADEILVETAGKIVDECVKALSAGNKILFMGNGGSAADSQHLAAELVSRFDFDRPGLTAIALTTDTSALTAIGNDYGFEQLFARQVEAVGRAGDVIFGISTSGRSENVNAALIAARRQKMTTVGMTGNRKEKITTLVDLCIEIPSGSTAKIQEGHIVIGHTICKMIEQCVFRR